MKILLIHSDGVEVKKNKEATSNPQKFQKEQIKMEGLILVAYVSVEDQDTYDTDVISKQAAEVIEKAILQITNFPEKIRQQNEQVREYNEKIESGEIKGKKRKLKELILDRNKYQVDKVLVYPWAHLSKFLSDKPNAMDVCPTIASLLGEKGIEAEYSPFGWYKSFKLNCLGHEVAEMYRDVKLYIQPEEHVENAVFKIITPKRKEYDINYDAKGNITPIEEIDDDDFYLFLKSELGVKREDTGEEPSHIKAMKEFELVDFEPNSDAGNLRWYTKGVVMKNLIKRYMEDELIDFGAVMVDTPIMYTVKRDKLTAQTARFPARTYWVESGNDRYLLRFAGDFLQFDMISKMNLRPQYFPLRLYEWEQYDFRREQEGELSGLRRLRGFVMPDLHTFCRNLDSSVEEFKKQYELSRMLMENMGLKSFLIFRTTQDFWAENKEWIKDLIEEEEKPAFLELWEDRYYYFILKFERPVLSAQNRSATLATIQIDVESSLEFIKQDGKKRQKYNISFIDEDNEKKYPIILHTSPAGGLERILWGLLENANREIENVVPGFKTWLSPIQVRILTISTDQNDYAEKLLEKLNEEGFRTDFDDRDESLGKKIRRSEIDWIPYTLIIGDKERDNQTISVRIRRIGKEYESKKRTSKQLNNIKLEKLLEMLKEDTKGFPNYKLPKPFRRFSTKVYFRK